MGTKETHRGGAENIGVGEYPKRTWKLGTLVQGRRCIIWLFNVGKSGEES